MTPTEIPARHVVLSRRAAMITAATLLLGATTAWAAGGWPPAGHSEPAFRDVLKTVQLAMSVLVPFIGVLAVTELHRPGTSADRRLAPRLLPVLGLTVGVALAGTLLAATATAWAGGGWPPAGQTATLVTGAVLVQLIAQLTGTASGMLLRRPVLAMASTVVVPMGTTALLGTIDRHDGLVRWLTPYGNAQALLAAKPIPSTFAGLCVVALLWCVVPNVLGRWHINRNAPL
ncbi:hypothetical protein [Rugosimonospora africana]|uniref:Integral membrane protein n=1 Tax=Rugosimonospora africana TaxID=556532 RepID=A0A8J3R785_9ACTN|nr:hypothetical protein [Rugosimonospora africana]GIH21306.1 hypothetical protein Raf01_94780 [Rugosimonospora africana]